MAEDGLRQHLPVAVRRAWRGEKLVILIILIILLTSAMAGVLSVLIGPDWASVWKSLLFGLLVGWVLGIFRWPAWRAALLVLVAGMIFTLLLAGGLDERISALITELARLPERLISSGKIEGIDWTSLLEATRQVFISIGVVLGRVFTWLQGLLTDQPTFDPVAAGFVWSTLGWMIAAWAGWMVEAGRNALLAVLPALLLNAGTLSYGGRSSITIYMILGATLVLIAMVQYDQRQQEWVKTSIAYPARKGRQMGNTALIVATMLVLLSALISSLSLQRIINWASDIRRPSAQQESGLAKSLGILAAATATPDTFTALRNPGLPRDLLIGSGPELSKELVMTVEVKDLSSIAQTGQPLTLYWRSYTYDIYTGHGWSSSATEQSLYQPGQPLQPDYLPDHLLIQQVVRPAPGGGGTIYAAGEPVTVNVPSRAAWRSSSDLFGFQTESNGPYEISSLMPVADERSLRAAGQAYPGWIVQRYLALPPEIPARIKELAIQLTATEPTPYDRARAIEQYLRAYPYTLDVPRPPLNQDLVDFFLYDLRKGYCDFYASAMVVLARAAGVPARFAIGYASGTYNLNSKRFVVTQADAHSWVEVYFPGLGWVPFEPTAASPLIGRSSQPAPAVSQTPTAPGEARQLDQAKSGSMVAYGVLAFIALAGIIWAAYDEIRLRRLKPQPAAVEVYRRMRRYGALLRVVMEPGETPYEFTASLSERVQEITQQSNMAASGMSLVWEAQSLAHRIVRLSYRPEEAEADSENSIVGKWKSLRWRLRLMWILQTWVAFRRQLTQRLAGFTENTSG